MSTLTILSIFVFFVLLFIFLEYRNEQKYQEERRRKKQKTTPDTKTEPSKEQKKAESKPVKEPEPKFEPKSEIALESEELQTEKQLPEANYPRFTHVRLVEMGLSEEEAKEFVTELIPQIETEIPLIEAAIQEDDFHHLEKLTHGIKGSATNLGTGGVSDLLVDYNTYLKTGTDVDITKAYFDHLINYTDELKAQYT